MGICLKKGTRLLLVIFYIITWFFLVWCGNDVISYENQIDINVWDFMITYKWNVKLSKVPLKVDDLDDIVDLYQEDWDKTWYKDSLLVAEKYFQWFWINAFVQDNLKALETNWLTLDNVQKKPIWLGNGDDDNIAVLVSYQIVDGLISEIPSLYVSQLFIPELHSVKLVSYITEDLSAHDYIKNSLENIR